MLIMGIHKEDSTTSTGPAGWRDQFRSSAGGTPVDAELDGPIVLADWVPTGGGDELARRDHKESTKSTIGTMSDDTTFILRHTPIR